MVARLRSAPPRLAVAPSRVTFASKADPNGRGKVWRRWYNTKRWQDLREEALVRDGYQCQQTGVLLIGKHPAPDSPAVDHIEWHDGDPDLFWDLNNLQSVSKAWHDGEKQKQEHAERYGSRP